MKSLSPGILILGVFAVAFGLVGAYGAKKYLQQPEVKPVVTSKSEATVAVPMALRDLPEGRTITSGDFTTVTMTEEELKARDLPDEFMMKASQIVSRTLCTTVKKGMAFTPLAFYPDGIGPSIAAQLPPDHRAVTIPFDGSAAAAKLITPGAMVDVLFRTALDNLESLPETTMTLLENVKVLAVGRQLQEGAVTDDSSDTVTLAVTPVQSRALKVVEDRGSLTLVLRSGEATVAENESGPITLPDLLGLQTISPPFKTEIYRRGQLTTVIHGAEGRQVIHETPYGMPVVGSRDASTSREARRTGNSIRLTGASQDASIDPCGCETSSTKSALVKGR